MFRGASFTGDLRKTPPYLYDVEPGMNHTLWITELASNRVGKLLIR